jgi:hypothetical protein
VTIDRREWDIMPERFAPVRQAADGDFVRAQVSREAIIELGHFGAAHQEYGRRLAEAVALVRQPPAR